MSAHVGHVVRATLPNLVGLLWIGHKRLQEWSGEKQRFARKLRSIVTRVECEMTRCYDVGRWSCCRCSRPSVMDQLEELRTMKSKEEKTTSSTRRDSVLYSCIDVMISDVVKDLIATARATMFNAKARAPSHQGVGHGVCPRRPSRPRTCPRGYISAVETNVEEKPRCCYKELDCQGQIQDVQGQGQSVNPSRPRPRPQRLSSSILEAKDFSSRTHLCCREKRRGKASVLL